MTLKELKALLNQARGKIIVVEDERPIMVITPYEEHELPSMSREGGLARRSPPEALAKGDGGGLTLDDLPL